MARATDFIREHFGASLMLLKIPPQTPRMHNPFEAGTAIGKGSFLNIRSKERCLHSPRPESNPCSRFALSDLESAKRKSRDEVDTFVATGMCELLLLPVPPL